MKKEGAIEVYKALRICQDNDIEVFSSLQALLKGVAAISTMPNLRLLTSNDLIKLFGPKNSVVRPTAVVSDNNRLESRLTA